MGEVTTTVIYKISCKHFQRKISTLNKDILLYCIPLLESGQN